MRSFIIFPMILVVLSLRASVAEPVLITAPTEPPISETWVLEEVWRIDSEDPDAPLLGVPSRGIVAPDGNVLILDRQLAHVLELTPEGEFVGNLSRKGEGPGELENPSDLLLFSDGAVGLLQTFPPKIVKLNRDGTPLDTISPVEGMGFWWRVREAAGVVVVFGQDRSRSESANDEWTSRRHVSQITPDGENQLTLLEKSSVENFSHPVHDEQKTFFPSFTWDLLPDGTLVRAVDRDAYRLEFLTPDGVITKVVERSYEPYRRSEEDFEELAKGVTYTRGDEVLEVETHFLPTDPIINSIQVLDDGSIWVSTCFGRRGLPVGASQRYDVFESDGIYRGEVLITYMFDEKRDAFGIMNDGGFFHVRNITGAFDSMYKGRIVGREAEDLEGEDVALEVIRLRRAG